MQKSAHGWLLLLLVLVLHSAVYLGVYAHKAGQGMSTRGDFPAFWDTARALAAGAPPASVYDTGALQAAIADPGFEGVIYALPYPPHFLPMIAWLGHLSFTQAMLAWLCATGALYLLAVFVSNEYRQARAAQPSSLWRAAVALFVVASPFALYNGIAAQSGYLAGGLLIMGLVLLPRYPIAAGVMFGLLTVKPQLGLLLPVMLLATRQWRAIGAAVATALLLAVIATYSFGMEIWQAYMRYTDVYLQALAVMPDSLMRLNASLYTSLLYWHVPSTAALAAQALGAVFAVWAVWRVYRQPGEDAWRYSVLICATFLLSPYIMMYDMTVAILPVLFWLSRAARGEVNAHERFALLLLLLAPILSQGAAGVPIVFGVMLFNAVVLLAAPR